MVKHKKRLILLLSTITLFFLSAAYSPSLKPGSAYYYNRGLQFDEKEDFDQAEKLLLRAVKSNPMLAEAHLALGAIYIKTDRLMDAERSILRTFEILPHSGIRGASYRITLSVAYNNLGAIEEKRLIKALAREDLLAAEGHLASSRAFYQEAMNQDPKNPLAYYNWRRLEQIIRTTEG